MISLIDVYHVLEAIVPLYVAMILAYASVKWWKLFTPDQCSGISKFVSKFSVPLLSFRVISANNPYQMNLKLMLSDTLQKIFALVVLTVVSKLSSRRSLDGIITGFSLSTLPNTLIVGIPLLKAMYGNGAATLLAQIVVLQSIIWYNLLLFLFEYRAAQAVSVTTLPENRGESDEVPQATRSKEREEEANDGSQGASTKLILLTVGKKLISNPNTHATLAGLIWSLISFRWELKLPVIIDKSISILADGGLGMAMFSLGLFMASQASIFACGAWLAVLAMAAKFLVGPALMAVASTAIIFGMVITVPVTLAYYFLLEL
ncbi:Auxin efflux carrier component [Thalictrum thalictroides]|uniref:Auxin efflux carrier component n=1 Tax=Thalictrum thalictroides TaxID=46969 RepID=A0A7J6WTE4_THATH|nr:Auxin efflux carrier component [Thalictrum thalictroides]